MPAYILSGMLKSIGGIVVYVALLYEGLGQQLVRYQAISEEEFFAKLNAQFGCYVCLWFSAEQVIDNDKIHIESAS